jgi:hypothetical protein
VLCAIEDLASYTPALVGESEEWAAIVSSAENNHESYCKALHGKAPFSALYGTYTVTLNELKNVLKPNSQAGQTKQADSFEEVRSRKRHFTGEAARTPKKVALPTSAVTVATENFFAPPLPLQTTNMDTDALSSAIIQLFGNWRNVCRSIFLSYKSCDEQFNMKLPVTKTKSH